MLRATVATRTAIALAILSALPAVPALPAFSAAAQESPTLQSYRTARAIVERAAKAMGGEERLRGIRTMHVRFSGDLVHRNQSRRPEPPYQRTPLDGHLIFDYAGGRFAYENRYSYPGGFLGHQGLATDGKHGHTYDAIRRIWAPMANPAVSAQAGLYQRMPHWVVLQALDRAATLRHLGRARLDGRPHDLVTYAAPDGRQLTLWFDAGTGLLTRHDVVGPDAVAGDATIATIYPGYRDAGGLKLPTGRRIETEGEPLADTRLEIAVDAPLHDSLFAPPAGFAIDSVNASPTSVTTRKVADDVYLIHGVAGNTVLAVGFADHILVMEPPGNAAASRAAIAAIREAMPGREIRYIAATHFHDDHTGGLRPYHEIGARVVATPGNVEYFRRMLTRPAPLDGSPTTPARAPAFEVVRGRRTFADGTRTVELIDIGPNPHTDEMLIAWLPDQRLVFQGDLLNASWQRDPRPGNETTQAFARWLEKSGLAVDSIAGVHGPMVGRGDLVRAVELFELAGKGGR